MTYTEALGVVVKRAREATGLSQTDLAWRAQISVPRMVKIESGEFNAELTDLWRIAEGLNIKPHTLVKAAEVVYGRKADPE